MSKEERAHGRLTDTYWVYSISDPQTGQVFYIGQTNNPRRRFYGHTQERSKSEKDRFITAMIAKDIWPTFTILERVTGLKDAVAREGYHIARMHEQGHPLLNDVGEMNYSRRFRDN